MAFVIVVADEAPIRALVCNVMRELGHEVFEAPDGPAAMAVGRRVPPRLALLDFRLPGPNGLEVFKALRAEHRSLIGIMFTGYGSIEHAFACAQSGMAAYLEKPIRGDKLRQTVCNVLGQREHVGLLASEFEGLVGTSAAMEAVYRQIERLAPLNETVLITGESGTGKELVARAIHRRSTRHHSFAARIC
jgi:two-component system response regulator AtoC